jgi:hypothetical protein
MGRFWGNTVGQDALAIQGWLSALNSAFLITLAVVSVFR